MPPSLAAIAALTQSLVHSLVYPLSLPSFPSLHLLSSFFLLLQPLSLHPSVLEVDTPLDRAITEAAPMDISATRDRAAPLTSRPPPSHVSSFIRFFSLDTLDHTDKLLLAVTCPGGGSPVGSCVNGGCASGYNCNSNYCCAAQNPFGT